VILLGWAPIICKGDATKAVDVASTAAKTAAVMTLIEYVANGTVPFFNRAGAPEPVNVEGAPGWQIIEEGVAPGDLLTDPESVLSPPYPPVGPWEVIPNPSGLPPFSAS